MQPERKTKFIGSFYFYLFVAAFLTGSYFVGNFIIDFIGSLGR